MDSNAITLSELQQRIKKTLENSLCDSLWITAEINELKTNSSGHCYLELVEKDSENNSLKAKISATIWAYTFRMLKPYFETSTGRSLSANIRVLVKATVQYHSLYGISLNISDIDPAYTVGEIEMQRRKTIAQLQADGVFDMNREIPFPILPKRVAIISSEQAAGYSDFMKHLQENEYGYKFRTQLFSSLVQGFEAAQNIIDNLTLISQHRDAFDVVVIIRGGGSATDLSCFDEYELASHIAQFPLPIITGIGHEKDTSVADMVAHTALKTPTAVADFLINCLQEQDEFIDELRNRLQQCVQQQIQTSKQFLQNVITRRNNAVKQFFQKANFQLQLIEKEIHFRNPATILERGYAVVSYTGKTLRNAAEVSTGDDVQITLHKGKLNATIKR